MIATFDNSVFGMEKFSGIVAVRYSFRSLERSLETRRLYCFITIIIIIRRTATQIQIYLSVRVRNHMYEIIHLRM